MKETKRIIDSPIKIMGLMGIVIFVGEVIILNLPLDALTQSPLISSILNAVLLTLFASSVFFKVVFNPTYQRIKSLEEFHGEMVKYQVRQEIYSSVFSETSEAVIVTDEDGIIVAVNPAATVVTGYTKEELIGKNPKILSSGKQTKAFYETLWESLLETGHWQGEIWNRKKTGELYAQHATISTIQCGISGESCNYVSVFHDITERKETEKHLYHKAHHDPLTGLPNRRVFEDRLQKIINNRRNSQKTAVLYLDLDRFKPVNDTYGHGVGDKLLIEVSQRIKSVIRKEDTLARVGGDEFTIIFKSIAKEEDVTILAEKIIEVVNTPFIIDDQTISIGVSIGISMYPASADTLEGLLLRADAAMYAAKNDGRNKFKNF